MEPVLDVYQRSYDPLYPVVCRDESNQQFVGDVQPPLPLKAGEPRREDSNYARHGTANLFLAFEPARGQRHVAVREHRKRDDWAWYVRKIVDELYPAAQKVTLVCDQLNTHHVAFGYVLLAPVMPLCRARMTMAVMINPPPKICAHSSVSPKATNARNAAITISTAAVITAELARR